MTRYGSLFLLLISVQLFLVQPVFAQPAELQGLDEYIEEARQLWNVPGLAVAIVKNDEIVYSRGFGVLGLGESGQINEHSLFGVASTSKAMTVAALGLLVDEGKLDWDDAVTDHLPWFRLSDPWATANVTVRDLLTHKSGLGRMLGNRLQFMTSATQEEVIRQMRYMDFELPFRSGYVYSNLGYSVAGFLIEAIEGVPWGEFLETRLFPQLEMNRSNTSVTKLDGELNAAWPHQEIEGEIVRIPRRSWDNAGPAGGVNSSVYDMSQWMRLHLGEAGVYNGNRILSEQTIREMHLSQSALANDPSTGDLAAYGLGLRLGYYEGTRTISHTGATDGMNTNMIMFPEYNFGIVIITNTFSRIMGALANRIADIYLDLPERDWSADHYDNYQRYFNHVMNLRLEQEAGRKQNTEPSLPLDSYTGVYQDNLYGKAEVSIENGNLRVKLWDDPELSLILEHWHHDTFRGKWKNPAMREKFLTFSLGMNGDVEQLRIVYNLRPMLLQVGVYPSDYTRTVVYYRQHRR